MTVRAWALVAVGLFSVSCRGSKATEAAPASDVCLAPAQRACSDWRCAAATLKERTPPPQAEALTGPLSVRLAAGTVSYQVNVTPRSADAARVEVVAQPPGGARCQLAVELTSAERAELEWGGVKLTGYGPLTDAQRRALASLEASVFVDALVAAPLELGCHGDVPRAYEAALLFPFQLMLKYDPAPDTRAAALRRLLQASACRYFGDRVDDQAGVKPGPLLVEEADPIPHVWDFTPFDFEGASEPSQPPGR